MGGDDELKNARSRGSNAGKKKEGQTKNRKENEKGQMGDEEDEEDEVVDGELSSTVDGN